ncbi:MAG TPA: alpha/beta fold hydrolase [Steroidobacteraceae bacterium]
MRTLTDPARAGEVAEVRMLMLPAAYTGPEDFVRAGFVSAVRERELGLDLVFADLNLQHLSDRTLLRRIRHELVLPARALGCRSIWICGISFGGFIAIAYAERYPAEIDGLCLLAPYLGNHMVTGEIERAHGVAAWQPGKLSQDDDERRVWQFIKMHRSHGVQIHLGYGREDRFVASHRMMGEALGAQAVHIVAGGHDWPVWRELWERFLDRYFAFQEARGKRADAGPRGCA